MPQNGLDWRRRVALRQKSRHLIGGAIQDVFPLGALFRTIPLIDMRRVSRP
jgi:hypothetical protein